MEIEQNRFAFYANFAETIKGLPEDKQAEAYKAICEYGIYNILPDDILLKSICLMAKNSIYKNEGGAPAGNKNAVKKQPQNNPKTTPKQPMFQETETKTETKTETETKSKTKTKTKTETEDKDSVVFQTPQSEYAFTGEVIKLNQKDYSAWEKAYPDLNLYAELLQRDKYLATQPPEDRKRWFVSTGQYFIQQNEKRKAQNSNIAEQYGIATQSNDDWF